MDDPRSHSGIHHNRNPVARARGNGPECKSHATPIYTSAEGDVRHHTYNNSDGAWPGVGNSTYSRCDGGPRDGPGPRKSSRANHPNGPMYRGAGNPVVHNSNDVGGWTW